MINLPTPLVPADTDVRNLDGFMLNVERLLASELWALATGEEFKAAVGLWCRAWKQFPAGSLPNDESVLAAFSGAGKNWKKVRDMALRGFVLCDDGRLYHKVLCEDVKRAALKKAERHERTKAATEARKRQRDVQRDVDRDDQHNPNVTTSHRQDRTGTGQDQTLNQEIPKTSDVAARGDPVDNTQLDDEEPEPGRSQEGLSNGFLLGPRFEPTDETHETMLEIARGWDRHFLVRKYNDYQIAKRRPMPRDPQAAFLGWLRSFTENNSP